MRPVERIVLEARILFRNTTSVAGRGYRLRPLPPDGQLLEVMKEEAIGDNKETPWGHM